MGASVTRIIDETWTLEQAGWIDCDEEPAIKVYLDEGDTRARLVSCAPQLAKMLLGVLREDYEDGSSCGWCGGPGGPTDLGHVEWPAVGLLKKAGAL